MNKKLTRILAVIAFFTFLFIGGMIDDIIQGDNVYGATILLTDSTSTIGTFRTNVNTSLTNLNTGLAGASVGGSDTQIQFNSAGSFGGDSLFIFASSTNRMTIGTSTQSEASALYVLASDAADHVLILRGASSPTAHLFMIEANDGTDLLTVTGRGELNLIHAATANNELSMQINTDSNGFGGITSLFMGHDVGTISTGDDESSIVISINRFDSTGGEVHGVKCLATTGTAEINCLSVRAGVSVLEQAVGTFGNMDSATITLGGDVLAAFISTFTDVTLFTSNGDVVIVGDANKFSELAFVLDPVASGAGVKPTFEFSTSTGQWLAFNPTDGTNGFRNSGVITWELDDIPTWATGENNEYLIRITRTQVGLSIQPVEDIVQISAVVEYFWDKNAFVEMASLNVSGTSTFSSGVTMTSGNLELSGASSNLFLSGGGDMITQGGGIIININGNNTAQFRANAANTNDADYNFIGENSLTGIQWSTNDTIDIQFVGTDVFVASTTQIIISVPLVLSNYANGFLRVDASGNVTTSTIDISSGANPTVDADGEIAQDTTANQLLYGSAPNVLDPRKSVSITIASSSFVGNISLGKLQTGITITDVHCIIDPTDSGESIVIDIDERDSTADNPVSFDSDITCDNDGAEDDGSISNAVFDTGDWWSIDASGAASTTIDYLTISIFYTTNRE